MLGGFDPFVLLRAAFLCVLILLSVGSQPADAQVDDPAVSVASDAYGVEEHEEAHSLVEEARGHCHPGLDCAVAAMTVEPTRAPHAPGFDGDGFRSDHIRLNGIGPMDEPPPPRGLALPEYGIVQT
jgi:hypothetical protein